MFPQRPSSPLSLARASSPSTRSSSAGLREREAELLLRRAAALAHLGDWNAAAADLDRAIALALRSSRRQRRRGHSAFSSPRRRERRPRSGSGGYVEGRNSSPPSTVAWHPGPLDSPLRRHDPVSEPPSPRRGAAAPAEGRADSEAGSAAAPTTSTTPGFAPSGAARSGSVDSSRSSSSSRCSSPASSCGGDDENQEATEQRKQLLARLYTRRAEARCMQRRWREALADSRAAISTHEIVGGAALLSTAVAQRMLGDARRSVAACDLALRHLLAHPELSSYPPPEVRIRRKWSSESLDQQIDTKTPTPAGLTQGPPSLPSPPTSLAEPQPRRREPTTEAQDETGRRVVVKHLSESLIPPESPRTIGSGGTDGSSGLGEGIGQSARVSGGEDSAATSTTSSVDGDERAIPGAPEDDEEYPPGAVPILMARALANRRLGRWSAVVGDLTRAHRLRPPDEAALLCARAAALGKLGRFTEAAKDCDQAIALNETCAAAYCNRAIAFRMLRNWSATVRDASAAIALDGENCTALCTRAFAFLSLNRFDEAIVDYTCALSIDPGCETALVNRLLARSRLQYWGEVVTDCEELLVHADRRASSTLHTFPPPPETGPPSSPSAGGGRGGAASPGEDASQSLRLLALKHRTTARRALGDVDGALTDVNRALDLVLRKAAVATDSDSTPGSPTGGGSAAVASSPAPRATPSPPAEALDSSSAVGAEGQGEGAEEGGNAPLPGTVVAPSGAATPTVALVPSELHPTTSRRRRSSRSLTAADRLVSLSPKLPTGVRSEVASLVATRAVVQAEAGNWSSAREDCNAAAKLAPSGARESEACRRLSKWIDKSEKEHLKAAEQRADDMCRLLIAEENSKVWQSAHAMAKAAHKNSKKKRRKDRIRKSGSRRPSGASEGAASEGGGSEGGTSDFDSSEFSSSSEAQPRSPGATTTSPPPVGGSGGAGSGAGCGEKPPPAREQDRTDLHPPRTVPAPDVPALRSSQASPRLVYERFFRSVELLEQQQPSTPSPTPLPTTPSLAGSVLDTVCEEEEDAVAEDDEALAKRRVRDGDDEPVEAVVVQGKLSYNPQVVLGKGSFGTVVYSGLHTEWGAVAVKVMDRSSHQVVEQTAQAEKEVHLLIARSQGHPNVIRYFGIEENSSRIFLAFERCTYSLNDIYRGDGRLAEVRENLRGSLDRQRRLIADLVAALNFLHSNGIVHGDFRPTNVLFNEHGTMKVSDFGLSRHVQSMDSSFTWNHGGPNGLGGWFAPEVYQRQRKTMAVDVFSLGCVIFFILSDGLHPFDNNAFNVVAGDYRLDSLLAVEPRQLVESMIRASAGDRPRIDQVLLHPFLWPLKDRLQYVDDVSQKLDTLKDSLADLDLLCTPLDCEPRRVDVDWASAVEPVVVESMRRFRSYDASSTSDLIRFVRNLHQHFAHQTREALLAMRDRTARWRWTRPQGKAQPEQPRRRGEGTNTSDEQYLEGLFASRALQRKEVSRYITILFPNLIVQLWNKLGHEV